MRILLVDDDPASLKLAAKILEPAGECVAVTGGRDAIAEYSRGLFNDNPFSLVLLDIMMPVVNGHETLIELRNLEKSYELENNKRAVIIMTTALSDTENFMQAFEEHCSGYLIKPLKREAVREELQKHSINL